LNRLKYFLLLLSASAFFTSLLCIPFTIEGDNPTPWPIGLWAILLGWYNLGDGAGLAWLANPFLFFAWIYIFRKVKVSFWLSLLATLFSLSFLLFGEVVTSEGGGTRKIISMAIGYYLWLGSIILLLFSTIVFFVGGRRKPFIHPHSLDERNDG
jgi:hypothetical protein